VIFSKFANGPIKSERMKVLLDTNIIIHREGKRPIYEDIGKLFYWFDKLKYEKCIHPVTIKEIHKHKNKEEKRAVLIKLNSYIQLPTIAPLRKEIEKIWKKYDTTENDRNDTALLNEVFSERVDFLITEDRRIHQKAELLGIENKTFTVEEFLEKVIKENPELLDYKVPNVQKAYFGDLDLNDPFFKSFKEDYIDYEKWFNKKAHEIAYVCKSDNRIVSILYLKREGKYEPYHDITPQFPPKNRLKIGTFKVQLPGFKLGERLLKIVFDNALLFSVDEIYVTIFPKREEQLRLINLLELYGFYRFGEKRSKSGAEEVYVRDFSRRVSIDSPKTTFPYMSRKARKFLVPILPKYHTSLFPDSILKIESKVDFIENEPFRNAISKVYVSRSLRRDLKSGDIIIFYRTGGYYRGVVTTLGIVEKVVTSIRDSDHLISLCKKRTVLSEKELRDFWERNPRNRPFIVNFLYAYSLPKRINLQKLIELGIIKDTDSAPRGFEEINDDSFNKIIRESRSNANIIVD